MTKWAGLFAGLPRDGGAEVTSRDEKFNLEHYLHVIDFGVMVDLEKDDPFRHDVKMLIEDIEKYLIKDRDRFFFPSASAQDVGPQHFNKERLVELYAHDFIDYIDTFPADLLQKHAAAISKVAKIIEDRIIAGAKTSYSAYFDLYSYGNTIDIGILPFVDMDDASKAELRMLSKDIDSVTIDYEGLKIYNKEHFGNTMPTPTVVGENSTKGLVGLALNGSGYNATDAVTYAHTWTENDAVTRNPLYNFFNGKDDCTNFVSQVLEAGGIPYVRNDSWGLDRNDPDNWYYANGFFDKHSWSWGGAQDLYTHLESYSTNVSEVDRADFTGDLQVGDLIMWDKKPDDEVFHIGHNTVITKSEDGVIYLTYHSYDREDVPMSRMINAGYVPYGWAINH